MVTPPAVPDEDGGQPDGGPSDDGGGAPPAGRPPKAAGSGRTFAAVTSGLAALILGATVVSVPVPYVVESPGPAYNTLGQTGGKDVISISGHPSYPARGSLDLTTVYVNGGPNSDVGLIDLARSWFDHSQGILPERVVYPPGTTRQQVSDENASLMQDSEQTSVAAALGALGIHYEQQLNVASIADGSPSSGKLKVGDRLVSVGGQKASSLATVQQTLAAGKGAPVEVAVDRGGSPVTATVTPTQNQGRWILGVGIRYTYSFPFEVQIELDRVGGPSAGMMFALGIIDKLTPGDLTGGKDIAGTGTIDPDGTVGAIGGIDQKLFGARAAGATLFLAPASNCGDVVGHIPDGLAVVKVSTLAEARSAVEAYAQGKDPASLPQCTAG
ncbi:PDZ domain-containing protein [Sinomonas atrocyanea]|uniref:YlbL family protein n=1 Tax=Sinomonas atrocyanea TaxID=37927 RepID=UPI002786CBE3|nr:PDZ domain-containing protein [Sinomonas atrocyanea]MDQ0258432.1 PDZ domain-containing protein [Sinomonas atrocyanea]